ncbi:MAG: oxidoreductase [Thermomicrobiales bacterium]
MSSRSLLTLPDRLLDRVTMYRLITLYLGGLLVVAAIQSQLGNLDYPVGSLATTTAIAAVACVTVTALFARTFGAPVNSDSAMITGLILALIVGPAASTSDAVFLAWAAVLAMASKYVLAVHHLHIFNPAAIALVITGLFANQPASWWVGTASMTPFVIAGGLLLVRKIRRGDVVWFFLWTQLTVTLALSALHGVIADRAIAQALWNSPAWFLAFVMLTEPITMPPTRAFQIGYGALAGLLVVPQLHVGTLYLSPEEALVIANAVAWPLRSHRRLTLHLERAITIGPGLVNFTYAPSSRLAYQPGQYMEWTLDHDRPDSRGKRRYFTMASSPTERPLRIGVRFSPNGSSYKRALLDHPWQDTEIVAATVAGDFTMPRDPHRKLAFIAGGIGVTPFRSMVKYLIDRGEVRDIVLLQAAHDTSGLIYQDVFAQGQRSFHLRHLPVVSDRSTAPAFWRGLEGHITATLIRQQVPDYKDRIFYISGSSALVASVRSALKSLGLPDAQIKTDDFSGLSPSIHPVTPSMQPGPLPA